MVYIVHYYDDFNRQHMAFVNSYADVKFLQDRFGEITVEAHRVD